jgi:uncharacterized protein (TIGR02466 family)
MPSNKIEAASPFEPLVHKLHYDAFDWTKLKPICNHLIDNTEREVYLVKEGKSSVFNRRQPHNIAEFKPFYDWLQPLVRQIIVHSAGYAKLYKYGIGNSWVNVHNEGGQTSPHNHPDAMFVAATYLQMPKDAGFFECKDPLEYHKCLNNHETPDWMWKEIPTVTGDVLIFPAWLQHRTQKNLSGRDRWVLTTNFYGMPVLPEEYFR